MAIRGLLVLLLLPIIAVSSAAPARVVERTYETPAYPCTPLDGVVGIGIWCAQDGYGAPMPVVADESIDLGAVRESPAPGETHVAVVLRDRLTQSGVHAFLCQDVNHDRGCDTGSTSPDRWAYICGGVLLPTAISATHPVHVLILPPGTRPIGCTYEQGPTVSGNVTFTFT